MARILGGIEPNERLRAIANSLAYLFTSDETSCSARAQKLALALLNIYSDGLLAGSEEIGDADYFKYFDFIAYLGNNKVGQGARTRRRGYANQKGLFFYDFVKQELNVDTSTNPEIVGKLDVAAKVFDKQYKFLALDRINAENDADSYFAFVRKLELYDNGLRRLTNATELLERIMNELGCGDIRQGAGTTEKCADKKGACFAMCTQQFADKPYCHIENPLSDTSLCGSEGEGEAYKCSRDLNCPSKLDLIVAVDTRASQEQIDSFYSYFVRLLDKIVKGVDSVRLALLKFNDETSEVIAYLNDTSSRADLLSRYNYSIYPSKGESKAKSLFNTLQRSVLRRDSGLRDETVKRLLLLVSQGEWADFDSDLVDMGSELRNKQRLYIFTVAFDADDSNEEVLYEMSTEQFVLSDYEKYLDARLKVYYESQECSVEYERELKLESTMKMLLRANERVSLSIDLKSYKHNSFVLDIRVLDGFVNCNQSDNDQELIKYDTSIVVEAYNQRPYERQVSWKRPLNSTTTTTRIECVALDLNDLKRTLVEFTLRDQAPPTPSPSKSSNGGQTWMWLFITLLVVVVLAAIITLVNRRRNR